MDCVHWQKRSDKQGHNESTHNITVICMCVFAWKSVTERAKKENVFVCDSELCPDILWDRWLEHAPFPFPKVKNLFLSMY